MANLLTTGDVAKTLKTSSTHVRRLIATGLLRASRVGAKRWRVSSDDLTAFLEARKNHPQEEGATKA